VATTIVHAGTERLNLRIFVDAAIDRRHAQRQMSSVGAHILFSICTTNSRVGAMTNTGSPAAAPRRSYRPASPESAA